MNMFWRVFFGAVLVAVIIIGTTVFAASGRHIVHLWQASDDNVFAVAFIWTLAVERFVDIIRDCWENVFGKEEVAD